MNTEPQSGESIKRGPVATSEPHESVSLGDTISDLWSDERCAWHVDYDDSAGCDDPWLAVLEWTQEYGNPHSADWVTYTWQFYGHAIEEALREAASWCEGLIPFAPCRECDGLGGWQGKTCSDCNGTGLANGGSDDA